LRNALAPGEVSASLAALAAAMAASMAPASSGPVDLSASSVSDKKRWPDRDDSTEVQWLI
jgi:hypothetical protein